MGLREKVIAAVKRAGGETDLGYVPLGSYLKLRKYGKTGYWELSSDHPGSDGLASLVLFPNDLPVLQAFLATVYTPVKAAVEAKVAAPHEDISPEDFDAEIPGLPRGPGRPRGVVAGG